MKSFVKFMALVALATSVGCGFEDSGDTGTAGTGGGAGTTGTAGTGSAGSGSAGTGAAGTGTAGTGAAGTGAPFDPKAPTLLSQTGLYTDVGNRVLAPNVYAFEPTYALWSDNASKQRWVYLPPGTMIDSTSNMDFWAFPEGTKLWKEFRRDNKLIETRLIQKIGVGLNDWYMVAFKWNADGKDAVAIPEGEKNSMGTQHDIPTKEGCVSCHKAMWDNVLGFSALQLSHAIPSGAPANTLNLAKISQMGWLTTAPAGDFVLPGTATEKAALGYLHANCGTCHNIYGKAYMTGADLDLWTHLDQMATVQQTRAYLSTVCDEWPKGPDTGAAVPPDKNNPITSCSPNHATGRPVEGTISKVAVRIKPQNVAGSAIHELMGLRGDANSMSQMPPLGTKATDPTGLAAVAAWINSLPLK